MSLIADLIILTEQKENDETVVIQGYTFNINELGKNMFVFTLVNDYGRQIEAMMQRTFTNKEDAIEKLTREIGIILPADGVMGTNHPDCAC